MDLMADRNELVKKIISYIEGKQGVANNPSNAKKTVKKFLDDISSVCAFNFFPYEVISIDEMAEFCASNMLSRGISFKKVEDSEDKSTSEKGFRELMNNLKTNNYFMLRKDRLLDTFVIEKGAINKEFLKKYQGNIPDYSNETLKKRSEDLIKKYLIMIL